MEENELSKFRSVYYFLNSTWIKIKSKEDELIQNESNSLKSRLLIEQKGHDNPYTYDEICEKYNINSHDEFIEKMDRSWLKVYYNIQDNRSFLEKVTDTFFNLYKNYLIYYITYGCENTKKANSGDYLLFLFCLFSLSSS